MLLVAITGAPGPLPARAQHISAGCPRGHRIALTFDDGPNPPWSERILDILTAEHVRATFFDEGEAARAHPDAVRDELRAGMEVGTHSYTHSPDLARMTEADVARDLLAADDALASALAARPSLYRAPYGHTSDAMLRALAANGYVSVGWDIDSTDWDRSSSVERIVRSVLDGAHPGAIVLMHDGGLGGGDPDRAKTFAALPQIVDGLRGRGYGLVTVSELTGVPETRGDAPWRRRPEVAC